MEQENTNDALPPDLRGLQSSAKAASRFAESLVGMRHEDARRVAEYRGCFLQTIESDSEPGTTDIRFDRIRCRIDDRGLVIDACAG